MSEELKLDPDVTREDAYNWFKSERQAHERTKHLLKQGLQYILEVKEKHYPNTDNSLVDGWIKDVKELLQ